MTTASLRVGAFAIVVLAAAAPVGACRASGGAHGSADAGSQPATFVGAVAAVAPSAGPPRRVRHDSARVAVDGAPQHAEWVMHESAPLVEPDTQPRPVTVLLHAICADDTWTCDWLQYFDMQPQWQLCPRAPVACGGGGWEWTASAPLERRLVEDAVATAKSEHGDRVRDDDVVLAGFSQGAYAVAAVVHDLARQPEPRLAVKGVLVQGAHVHFAPEDVKRLGARVALVAGERDATASAMRNEAMALQRAGVDARYVSLGEDEGHYVPVAAGKTIAQIVDWCRGD